MSIDKSQLTILDHAFLLFVRKLLKQIKEFEKTNKCKIMTRDSLEFICSYNIRK